MVRMLSHDVLGHPSRCPASASWGEMKLRATEEDNSRRVNWCAPRLTRTLGFLFFSCLGVASAVSGQLDHSAKPATGEAIQFVSQTGNDSDDGRSWVSAKHTIYAAWSALPNASCNSGLSTCGGTIFIANNVTWGGPVPGQGLRILGAKDPNRLSPPAGWLVEKPVKMECIGPSQWDSNQAAPSCIVTGESGTQPAIWISGNAMPMEFDGIKVLSGSGSVLGKDSNGLFENNAGVTNITFRNCAFGLNNNKKTNGPGLRIGPNSFENYFYGSVFDGNPNATGGTEARQAVVLDPGSSANNDSGEIYLSDSHLNGGALEVNPIGQGSAGAVVTNLVCENQTDGHGCVWITTTGPTLYFNLTNVWTADASPANVAVEVDGNGPPDSVTVISPNGGGVGAGGAVSGPAIVIGSPPGSILETEVSPDRQHQTGFLSGRVLGQTDAARRGFSPTAVRFANLAHTAPSSWTTAGGGAITKDIAAPDGTLGAATCSSTSHAANCYFYNANQTFAVGDAIVVGAWARARNAGGFSSNQVLGWSTPFCGNRCGFVDISGKGGVNSGFVSSYIQGDGSSGHPPAEWEWYWKVLKVTAASGSPVTVQFVATVDPSHPADYYGPMFLHVAANTISDNEATELGLNLQPYESSCVVGSLCGLPGQTESPAHLGQMAANQFAGTAKLSNGSATVIFPTPYHNAPICVANDTTATSNGIKPTPSATRVEFSGAGMDSIAYICIGNPN